MRNTTQVDRKPTAPQARWINEAIDGQGSMAGVFRINLPERSRQIMIDAGWLVEVDTPHRAFASEDRVTDAGRMAVGRADTIRIPDVQPGDVLVYRSHPGCAFRVTEVIDHMAGAVNDKVGGRGQGFKGVFVTTCDDCRHRGLGQRPGQNVHTDTMIEWAFNVRRPRPSEVAAEVFHVNDRWAAGQAFADQRSSRDTSQWTEADFDAYAAHVQARTAKRAQAQREMDEAEAEHDTPRHRVFDAAVRQGKSYQAAMDILHVQAAKMEAQRQVSAAVARAGVLRAAEARTGTEGARTLIPAAEAADVAEGQVLAGVRQAARANGCPPLCDASAVLHLVLVSETANRDFWPADRSLWPVPRRGGVPDATKVMAPGYGLPMLHEVARMDPVLWAAEYAPESLTMAAGWGGSGFSV